MAKVVAFLGLGNMGSGMSENLVKAGFDVRGFDPVPATRERAAAAGLTVFETAAEAASGAEVICSSVPEVEHAKDAYLGETGALTTRFRGRGLFRPVHPHGRGQPGTRRGGEKTRACSFSTPP